MARVARLALALAVIGVLLWVSAAAKATPSRLPAEIVFQGKLWLLNADPTRQPPVPMLQRLDVPPVRVETELLVSRSAMGISRLSLPDLPIGAVRVTRTVQGDPILVANPSNRFDPFTGRLQFAADFQAGTAQQMGGTAGEFGGSVPFDLAIDVVLDEIEAGGPFFTAQIPLDGALGQAASATFSTVVQLLSIPIFGTAFGQSWTTGPVAISRQVITRRLNNDPKGTPTGFVTLVFQTEGSRSDQQVSLVTPFVVEVFAGSGDEPVAFPLRGFLRTTLTVIPEPATMVLLAMGLIGLLGFTRRRAD